MKGRENGHLDQACGGTDVHSLAKTHQSLWRLRGSLDVSLMCPFIPQLVTPGLEEGLKADLHISEDSVPEH